MISEQAHEKLRKLPHIYLEDGTLWPNPCYDPDGFDPRIAASRAAAYTVLMTHPWGANGSERKMRMIRRALKKAIAMADKVQAESNK